VKFCKFRVELRFDNENVEIHFFTIFTSSPHRHQILMTSDEYDEYVKFEKYVIYIFEW